MSRLFEINKKFLIFPVLFVVTLLLLEIPGIIFQSEDKKLLIESGSSKYEMKIIRNMDSLSSKINFLCQKDIVFTVGYAERYQEDIMLEKTRRILEEFDILLGEDEGTNRELLSQTVEDMEVLGFETQIICRSETEKEQYVWTVGMLDIQLSEQGEILSFIYDADTFEIYLAEWFWEEKAEYLKEQDMAEKTYGESIMKYYDADTLENITIFEEEGYGTISVFPEEEIYNNRLIIELYELRDYYWGSSETEDEIMN